MWQLYYNLLRNLHTVVHTGCTNFHSYQQCRRVAFWEIILAFIFWGKNRALLGFCWCHNKLAPPLSGAKATYIYALTVCVSTWRLWGGSPLLTCTVGRIQLLLVAGCSSRFPAGCQLRAIPTFLRLPTFLDSWPLSFTFTTTDDGSDPPRGTALTFSAFTDSFDSLGPTWVTQGNLPSQGP